MTERGSSRFGVYVVLGVAAGITIGSILAVIVARRLDQTVAAPTVVAVGSAAPTTIHPDAPMAAGVEEPAQLGDCPGAHDPIELVIREPLHEHSPDAEASKRASQLNDRGKQAMFDNHYGTSRAFFAEAVAVVPEAMFQFNLAVAAFQCGRFGEAMFVLRRLQAIPPSSPLHPKQSIIERSAKLMQRVREEMVAQHIPDKPD